MAFMINSSPGAGLLFEPSVTFADAKTALDHAVGLSRRGMRLIKIRDTVTGEVFDERGFRQHLLRLKMAALDEQAE